MQTSEPDLDLNLVERPERHYFSGITATHWYRLAFLFPALEFLWLAVFYTFCYRVRWNLGHWPESIIDEGGLGRSVHFHLSAITLFLLLVLFPMWATVLIITRIKLPRLGRPQLDVLLWLAILLPPIVVGIFDPGGLFHWWLD